MRRWNIALLVSILLIAASAAPASASTLRQYVKWRTSDSNTTKTYTFNQVFSPCNGDYPSYRLRMAVRLGTVTPTSAYVYSVKLTWDNFSGGNPNGIWAQQTSVSDDDGHGDNGTENPPQNYEGGTFTSAVNMTFHFSSNRIITVKQTDAWPISFLGGCKNYSYVYASFSSTSPS